MKNISIVIPARMDSSRFPGKPMKKINGIPMIGHCYYRANMSKLKNSVYVATCDKEISDYVKSIGGNVIMTSHDHHRASERVGEAIYKIEKMQKKKIDIVVLYQGDEPMVTPDMIDESIMLMANDDNISVINLMNEIDSEKEFCDPNEVKVVVDHDFYALYFSREPIPSKKKFNKDFKKYKQVCVIPFKRDALHIFNSLEETELEKIESIDMLRLLENKYKVKMILSNTQVYSVDTDEDLKKVEKKMKSDKFVSLYG